MKILVVCQYYYPEPFRHSDICEELVKRGHEVMVVTGIPNYPMGEIYEGYRNGERRDEVLNGVKVHRCFTIGRKNGIIYRILNYYSYAFSSVSYVKNLGEKYDIVFVNQLSPVMMAEAAIAYKRKFHVPIIMYCLDLWPVSMAVGGIKNKSLIYKIFKRTSDRIYKQADKLLITSQSFAEYFEREFGIIDTEYLPQYAESLFTPDQCKKSKDGYIDLMFAGNVGVAQSVETIIEAAKLIQNVHNLRWHIVGNGSEIKRLKEMAVGMENVIFHGRQPLSEMPKYYSMADAMLVTMQKDPTLSLTLPGKVQTYMAAGKPVIGAIDGEAAMTICDAACGVCGPAENAELLAKNARMFLEMDREQLGKNARAYYEAHFEKQMFMDRLEDALWCEKTAKV